MNLTQFAWLIAPQILILLGLIGWMLKSVVERWNSKLRYDCTAHVPDMQVRLESLQRGQERLLSRLEELQRRS